MMQYFYFNFIAKLGIIAGNIVPWLFHSNLFTVNMSSSGIIKILKITLFVPFFLAVLFGFYKIKQYRTDKKRNPVGLQVGKTFPLLPLLDTSGNAAVPGWSKRGFTIIDFWYKNCPGCIAEMRQFEEVLKGKEAAVSIISISIDSYDDWRGLFSGNDRRFSFISKPVSNWQHLLLKAGKDVESRGANSQLLSEKLAVMGYPSFFVVDKKGIIKAVPISAVDYIKTNLTGQNGFSIFLKSKTTWTSFYILLLTPLIVLVYLLFFNIIKKQLNRPE